MSYQPGYPAPQPGYPPQQQMHAGQPGAYPGQAYPQPYQQPMPVAGGGGPGYTQGVYGVTQSTTLTCPNCSNKISTRTEAKVSMTQWIIYIILYFFFPICCCFPCYIPSCFQVIHSCPICNQHIGSSQ
ncbi:unnamed protein product [Moneuplotes crassus]|uniref:LITAF domain-containing protein n=1 Tax=Euplotes crassus TaxID=5936 RepID=A0AAD2D9F0_EUPCR|nr:unnamed protein product [Moneuplotes crassus]